MSKLNDIIMEAKLPTMYRVRQSFNKTHIENVTDEIYRQIARPEISSTIHQGMRVAVTAGSRGICHYPEIIRATVDMLKELGADPFILPAMGSHGGATAEGQVELLDSLGITEAACGAKIVSSMDVVCLGKTDRNVPVWFSKDAYEADATVLIGRVKLHTAFHGMVESGVVKMGVIGCGKRSGAECFHSLGMENMATNIVDMGNIMLKKSNVAFGIAIVENAYDETMIVEAIPRENIMHREHELLREAASNIARIMMPEFDVLVVDRIGKNISGDGADPNITGRFYAPGIIGTPQVQRLVYLDLTEESHGNAVGLGVADFISHKLFEKIDRDSMYMNIITNCVPVPAKIPAVMDTQELAVKAAIRTLLNTDRDAAKLVRIQDTMHLGEIQVSEALLDTVRTNPNMEILGCTGEMQFDRDGNII